MKEFFSHDYNARNDKKLVRLFMKHKLLGIGAFWCIIEMLYEEGGYLLRTEYERIAFELHTENDFIKSVIEDFDLFQFDDDKLWSETALERLKLRSDKSEKARKAVEKRWAKYKSNTDVQQLNNACNTSKVKESKVKESKVKESKVKESKDFIKKDFEDLKPFNPNQQTEMKEHLLSKQIWHEEIAVNPTFKGTNVKNKLEEFCNEQILCDGLLREEREIKQHFINWLKQNKDKAPANETTEQMVERLKNKYRNEIDTNK